MKNILSTYLKTIDPTIADSILTDYTNAWQEVTVPKKTLLTKEGQTQKELLFVVEGIQKSYYLNDGKEHVIAFTYAPSFSGIPESFFTQSPSNYHLKTISDSVLLKISYQEHMRFLHEHRPIESLYRKALEHLLGGLVTRHHELMAFSIEERFRAFTKRSPHLLNLVPHKDIASYLRIDPSNFSKLMGTVKI